ncbi:hypothetical protein SARC_07652 [Sphaeroforma arctica JP610]|uniref:LNR domain-containing protein n=1 Tax=Sphaeroforma arctica JP610 TaxID=667725 RepID=A0A0L0FTE6_9EUKA|nr:hypothetical protein SARC_07652 [Sphaeroforma arctica JP610]KNC79969.1 hypothetical protein SARC_07652 [Sphaeroforma arctica JP610]|eukprot:XP_014153871.1 hypothetical protein SARC_07652 [Sphaeroforma arctica JP610]
MASDSKRGASVVNVKMQGMRGCELDFESMNVHAADSPCTDGGTPLLRLPSDMWMLRHRGMGSHAHAFARDDSLFAKEFGNAYQRMLHLSYERCGASGKGCHDNEVCVPEISNGILVSAECEKITAPVDRCDRMCATAWLGDSECDQECNNQSCNWDNGDCQTELGVGSRAVCGRRCAREWLSDGECDVECNSVQCGFDGGDRRQDSPRPKQNRQHRPTSGPNY